MRPTLQLQDSYIKVHDMIRSITGKGAGNGPYIAIADGFEGVGSTSPWILNGADRVMLDVQ